jgi:hypothetical protein
MRRLRARAVVRKLASCLSGNNVAAFMEDEWGRLELQRIAELSCESIRRVRVK